MFIDAIMLARLLTACLFAVSSLAFANDAARIDHLEPPFWWAGMQERSLQLLVHGPGMGAMMPSLRYAGVHLKAVQRTANPNYLFLDLLIDAAAKPGSFAIDFRDGERRVSYRYELKARRAGSAQRASFSSADVVLNLMPDRFANGDPSNDSVATLQEKADRAAPSGRHGGDLKGILDHLDYIAGMGYTAVWPTPLLENDQPQYSYHGYAATDFYKVDARYGSNADYVRLSAELRARGMGLIHDVVLSHIGSGHWWMRDLPSPDWINHGGKFVPTKHFRTAVQDPYAAKEDADNFTQGWFVESMPDMNQRQPLLAKYLIQNSIWWIEYADLYGLRIDTFGYSDTKFLSDWSRAVMREYPKLSMVGEEWSGYPNVVAHWLRGKKNFDGSSFAMSGMIDFPLQGAVRDALLAPEGMGTGFMRLYEIVGHDHLYPEPKNMLLFEGNHDVPRTFSVLNEDIGLWRMAMAFTLTMPRIAQLYYGSEVLMTSPKERDDAAARRDFPGGWAGDAVNAFTGAGLTAQQKEAQAWLKKLITWRKTAKVIHDGKLMHYGPEQGAYVYFRYDGKNKVMVAFNKSKEEVRLPVARYREMLAGVSSGDDVLDGRKYDLRSEITIPARGTLVLELH